MNTATIDDLRSTAPNGVYLLGEHRERERLYDPHVDGFVEGPTSLYGRVDDMTDLPAGVQEATFRPDGKRVVIVRAIDGTVSDR